MPNVWRKIENLPGFQQFDGNGHLAFYDGHRLLSFIWDGKAEWIEVSYGGYGEPVEWIVPAFVMEGTPAECIEKFEQHCRSLIPEWDGAIWNDGNYTYHECLNHCSVEEKHVPIPRGRPYYGRDGRKIA